MSTEEKKITSGESEVNESDCYTDRSTVSTVDNKEGEIFLIDNVNFGIRYQGDDKPLLPCNLPGSLQKAGKAIVFSGAIKEAGLNEMWAAQPFVLTSIEEK